jgi:hypothetical protein
VINHGQNCAGLLARVIQQLETCANKRRVGVRAGPSPLKNILVGSTLVDRPAYASSSPLISSSMVKAILQRGPLQRGQINIVQSGKPHYIELFRHAIATRDNDLLHRISLS